MSDLAEQLLNDDSDARFAKINEILNKQFLGNINKTKSRLFENNKQPNLSSNREAHSVGSHGHTSVHSNQSAGLEQMDIDDEIKTFKKTNKKIIDLKNNKYYKFMQGD